MSLSHGLNVSRVRRARHSVAIVPVVAALLMGCGSDEPPTTDPDARFDADRAFADLEAQVAIGPRPAGSEASARTADLIARGLREAGVEDVSIGGPLRNVVGTLEGTEPGYIVLGAHHDTDDIEGLIGANDGASGVAVVLELARSLPRPFPGPSLAFALFDAEEARGDRPFAEDGKRGSTAYVEAAEAGGEAGIPPLDEMRAAVIFDMVGDCDLRIPYEPNSDTALYEAFAGADPDVFSGRSFPIDDDHVPFAEAGVPALDLIDFEYGPGASPGEWWHTTEDTLDKVCPESLGAVGAAAEEALPELATGDSARFRSYG